MAISLTQLRSNLYQIVDQVLDTGLPIDIERKGMHVKIVPVNKKSKLANLSKHPSAIRVDPEHLVHITWSPEGKIKDKQR